MSPLFFLVYVIRMIRSIRRPYCYLIIVFPFIVGGHNYMKDLLLVFSIVVGAGGCWLAYHQNKCSQDHLKKVMGDLDNLQKAEDNLSQLQEQYETHF